MGSVLLHLWKNQVLRLWEAFITLVGNYYACGKHLLHLWEIITFVKIITFVGVTALPKALNPADNPAVYVYSVFV